jgi:16S rRNA C967 or C1407 C5-methylase (RsmB/RsmF family)
VQDASAQLAAQWLAPRAGERVLDACAAPGGKTGALLEMASGPVSLTAIDSDAQRLARVRENLQRLQREATLLTADLSAPPTWWDGLAFDAILLDAPCSGTGVIRRHPDIKLLRRASRHRGFAARQLRCCAAAGRCCARVAGSCTPPARCCRRRMRPWCAPSWRQPRVQSLRRFRNPWPVCRSIHVALAGNVAGGGR